VSGIGQFATFPPYAVFDWIMAAGTVSPSTWAQVLAAFVYTAGLIGALVVVLHVSYKHGEEHVVPVLVELNDTLKGVAVGALAVILGVSVS
jgi:hypothetical protein